ncbi:MAG TPA: maltose ABC transporter substrate-binding protein [Elusimicrobiales bacterium]|nr:maltose ABC transporter substrate-binding protein [Elusimicrobiales bacterium]
MKRELIILAVAGALAACSRPVADTSKTIVVWEQEDAQVAPYIDSVFDAFKKLPENAGLNIVRTHYQTEDLRSQFQAASLAGVAPDLLLGPSDTAGLYAISGFIMPLDGLFDFSRYNAPVVEAITLDGHSWGVPVSNGNHLMMFYNKKFVKSPPKTTDELFAFCAGPAKQFKLERCMAFDMGEPFWMMPWLGAFRGWPIDAKKPTLDTQPMRDTINFYLDLKYEKKYVPMECDYNCMDSLFKESKTAFIINGDWAISGYQKQLKKDFGLCVIPKLSKTGLYPTPMVSGKYFMISSGAKPEKLAMLKRLLEFYTSKENQVKQYQVLTRLPALKAAGSAPEITSDEVSRISLDQILKGRPMPMATEMRAVWDSARNYLGLASTRKLDVDTAVRKMQENAAKKIDEMNQ